MSFEIGDTSKSNIWQHIFSITWHLFINRKSLYSKHILTSKHGCLYIYSVIKAYPINQWVSSYRQYVQYYIAVSEDIWIWEIQKHMAFSSLNKNVFIQIGKYNILKALSDLVCVTNVYRMRMTRELRNVFILR